MSKPNVVSRHDEADKRKGKKPATAAWRLFAAIADKSLPPQERADHAAVLAGLGPKANQPLILPLGQLARGEADAKVQSWLAAAINEGGYARVGNCRQQAVGQLRKIAGFAADDSVWNLATQYRVALRKLEP